MSETEQPKTAPAVEQPLAKFTFLLNFEILHPYNGGYILTQIQAGKNGFSKAYSNLDDLVSFLVAEKEKFEYDNS